MSTTQNQRVDLSRQSPVLNIPRQSALLPDDQTSLPPRAAQTADRPEKISLLLYPKVNGAGVSIAVDSRRCADNPDGFIAGIAGGAFGAGFNYLQHRHVG